jgi:type III secretory pathway component EscU
MKFIKPSWMSAAGVAAALAPWKALAQNPFNTAINSVTNIRTNAGLTQERSLEEIIGSIINVILGFLGIVFLVLMLWAGFKWMTARGDETKVEEATTMIRQAIIGLAVILAAFAISNYVLNALVRVTTTG